MKGRFFFVAKGCDKLWDKQWFQSYSFPLPRLRFLDNVFLTRLFCNVPFLQWLPTSFPSLFPSELSAFYDAFNRPPPVSILLPPNQPRSLEHSATRIIHSAIYQYITPWLPSHAHILPTLIVLPYLLLVWSC